MITIAVPEEVRQRTLRALAEVRRYATCLQEMSITPEGLKKAHEAAHRAQTAIIENGGWLTIARANYPTPAERDEVNAELARERRA